LYFILGAFVALVPLHLQQELGYGALAVGLSFTAFAILSLLLHYPAGILADRYGPATPATVGLVAVAIAMASIPLLRDLPTLLILMALFGLGHGFVFPSASALVWRAPWIRSDLVPARRPPLQLREFDREPRGQ